MALKSIILFFILSIFFNQSVVAQMEARAFTAEFEQMLNSPVVDLSPEDRTYDREQEIDRLIISGDPDNQLPKLGHDLALIYMRANHWQEAIWSLGRTGHFEYAEHIKKFIIYKMRTATPKIGRPVGRGVSRPHWIIFELSEQRSISAVGKPVGQSHGVFYEMGMYYVDQIFHLNIVPLVADRTIKIYNESKHVTLHLGVHNALEFASVFKDESYKYSSHTPDIYVLDFLVNNIDRDGQNIMLTSSQRIFSIDGNRCLLCGTYDNEFKIYDRSIIPSAFTLALIQNMTEEQMNQKLRDHGLFDQGVRFVTGQFRQLKHALANAPVGPIPAALKPILNAVKDEPSVVDRTQAAMNVCYRLFQ